MKKNLRIGEVLVSNGYITEKQLDRALEVQQKTKGKRLGDILVELSYVTEKSMLECLSQQLGAPLIDVKNYDINAKAVTLVRGSYARKNHVLPLDFQNNMLVVATNDPLNYYVLDEMRTMTGYETTVALAIRHDIDEAIERFYSEATVNSAVDDINKEYAEETTDETATLLGDRLEGAPVVKMVNTLVTQAYMKGASDIHIEPFEKNLVVRIRVNGDLIHHTTMNIAAHNSILTRLKILGGMNIAEKRVPQDGKYRFSGPEMEIDIRISTLPTVYGEKAVLRLLNTGQQANLLDIRKVGLPEDYLQAYMQMLKSPNGIILVTGPTGSGKSTTLYATLNQVAQKKINIITVEDPVEKRITGINQVQVNPKAGLTFVEALRSILRQDPDLIMIGEMRDVETATIGIRAAITGHLVFSTLHTNDAAASITRLIDMGVAPYMVAASLTGIIAQRLVKRLCPHCKEEHALSEQERHALADVIPAGAVLYKAVGCHHCNYTGYQGRMPIFEMIAIDSALREIIARDGGVQEIRRYMKEHGMRFLRDNVTQMALNGETSVEEMEKIIYSID